MFEQLSIYNYFNCARIFLKKNLLPSGYFELNFNSLHPCIVPPHLSRHARIMTIYNIKINIGSAMKLDHWFILKRY